MRDLKKIFINAKDSIEHAVAVIQQGGVGIALIVDDQQRLLGTVTDGDIRRSILRKMGLDQKVQYLIDHRPEDYPVPVTAAIDTSHAEILRLMEQKHLRQIPLLDQNGKVVELAILSELLEEEHSLPLMAVIMAGGKGQRLLPLTQNTPKPMLLLNDRPIIEHTIKQVATAGIKQIYVSTNYKSEVIHNHLGKGENLGVDIRYIHEQAPLGTAGALGLIDRPSKPILVVNGDIVTHLNFRYMYDYHRSHQADMTVGVRIYEIEIPYGVIETQDVLIKNLIEKPKQVCTVNAGIYIINPSMLDFISRGNAMDMTDLVHKLLQAGKKAVCFPIQEYWLDVGRPVDYERAQMDLKKGRD